MTSERLHTNRTVLLLGAGYSATALIAPLRIGGYHVIATTRSPERAKILKAMGAETLIYTGERTPEILSCLGRADILLSSIPPSKTPSDNHYDPVLRSIRPELNTYASKLGWVGYLSATSVYGDRTGGWAFEDEYLHPVTNRGRARVEAELEWLETGLPVHIFRLAGIYGPLIAGQSRNPFTRIKSGKARAVIKPGHIVNRIHVEDIARAVLASIEAPDPTQIYNLADDHPAPPQDVLDFAADLINSPRPLRVDHDTADISDMARSFYKETKRISNARAKRLLGWEPLYADYRQGLRAIIKTDPDI